MRNKVSFLVLGLLQLFISCSRPKKTILYRRECNGKTLQLQLVIRETWETTYHHHELLFDDKNAGTINYKTLDRRLPGNIKVYGSAPWHFLDTTNQIYSIQKSGPLKKIKVVLYINPEQWSIADFEQLYNCMQQHYKALQQSIEESKSFQRYQFGGMVYGNEESFVKEYAKNKKDFFSIHPDGKIAHHYEGRGLKVTSSNGLSMYVQKGNVVVIEDSLQTTMAELKEFKNIKTGSPMTADYEVKYPNSNTKE